ncbi:MAG: exo-alpha-sialidase, partial [Candidatus Eisenbacteria sp.]|nr:exo-alpha-sialidase [Candidatus Eisenbacteria bacterium]
MKRRNAISIPVVLVLTAVLLQLTVGELAAQTPPSFVRGNNFMYPTRGHPGRRAVQTSDGNIHVALFDTTGVSQVLHMDKYSGWTVSPICTFPDGWTNPSIAVDPGDGLHVVWRMKPGGSGFGDIFYSTSLDDGLTWEPPINVSNTPNDSGSPVIDIGPNDIHVAWQEEESWPRIYYSSSPIPAAAGSFTPALDITGPSVVQGGEAPSIANAIDYSSGTIHVAWAGWDPGGWYIAYRSSPDTGTTWSPPLTQPPLNASAGYTTSSWRPYACISVGSDDNPHIAYHDTPPADVYHVTSANQGMSFLPPTLAVTTSPGEYWPAPSVANYTSNCLDLVWHDSLSIYHAASNDNGTTWTVQGPVGWGMWDEYPNLVYKQVLSDSCDYVWTHTTDEVYHQRKRFPLPCGTGKTIAEIVDLSPFFDWGAISSYPGLVPPGFMGIWSPSHSTYFYFPFDDLAPNLYDDPRAWLMPGVHLATYYGPSIYLIPGNPMVTVPDRYSRACTLFVEVPPVGFIDEATDLNVIQVSSGEVVIVPIDDFAGTMVFLANCDGAGYCSPDQPLLVEISYQDGTVDSVFFSDIHPGERGNNIYWGPYTIYGNEVFGCGPFQCDLPVQYSTDAHSEFWHWYA